MCGITISTHQVEGLKHQYSHVLYDLLLSEHLSELTFDALKNTERTASFSHYGQLRYRDVSP